MRVVSIGGGPGGLFAAILLRLRGLADEVTVLERNGPDDTFGFGIVFSDETFDNIVAADPLGMARIGAEFRHWQEIDVVRGEDRVRSTGHGFSAMSRLRFLKLLAGRAQELGVDLRFHHEVDIEDVGHADLIIAADGANSGVRARLADRLGTSLRLGDAYYAWFGTHHVFDNFTFVFVETPHGVVQAHCYPYSADMSTVIVETGSKTWRQAGLDSSQGEYTAPGETDKDALAYAEDLFSDHLGGAGLIGNNSKWIRFLDVANDRWHLDNVVLLGDAAHTAHFSIGSGTKLAMEDAIALADALEDRGSVTEALAAYEAERRPPVASIQRAAATSRRWFEAVDRYIHLDAEQFTFQLLTRSQRITYQNLALRDPQLMKRTLAWFRDSVPADLRPSDPSAPPMFYPFRLRDLRLENRIGVSPMAQYCAVDGMPGDWHLVHLGSRAIGGAGLVMTEMTCVSPDARITPGCTGMWSESQGEAWARIVEFVHDHSDAKIGIQLGHAGRKGSTRVPWDVDGREDVPLPSGNWPLLSASTVPWRPHNQVPRAMTRSDMDRVRDDFVHSALLAAEAGFDLLELHMAHGYLLSSFLSPLTNRRRDGCGGDLEARARYPLEVLSAVRAVWPDRLPISVRISAVDWVEEGNRGDDAVALTAMLADAGCDIIDVSTGQVHPDQDPEYGRLYQTPFADRIRHEADIPTMTVGTVSSVDDVNTIIVAGRADLCLLARAHLVDPYWTLNAAIDQQYAGHPWPPQYRRGQNARRREQDPTARLDRGGSNPPSGGPT